MIAPGDPWCHVVPDPGSRLITVVVLRMRMAATEEQGHGAHPVAPVLLVLSLLDECMPRKRPSMRFRETPLGHPQTMSACFQK